MPFFWNKKKKQEKEAHRAQAQDFLKQTDVIVKGPVGPTSIRSPSPTPLPAYAHQYPWSSQILQVPSDTAPLFPRYGHSVLPSTTPNDDTYLFGGLVSDTLTNDVYLISNFGKTPSATKLKTYGDVPPGRVGHAMALVNDLLVVWGGDNAPGSNNDSDTLYAMNIGAHIWTRVSTSGRRPKARYGHTAIALGSRFVIFGGQADSEFFNDMWWIDMASPSSKWFQVEPFKDVSPSARTGHIGIESNGQLYIFGGTDGVYHYNDIWTFDWNTQQWSELKCTGLIPAPREGHAAAVVNNVIYIFGGRGTNGMDLDDLSAFVISDQRWLAFQDLGPEAPSGRSGHKMVVAGAKIYSLGGENYNNPTAQDPSIVHVLDTDLST